MATPTFTITRGAAYLLEAALQRPDAFTTTSATVRAARAWDKIRKLNPCKDSTFNFEKGVLRPEGVSDADFQKTQLAFSDAFDKWQEEEITVELTEKLRVACVSGINWAVKNRDKLWPRNNNHVLSLLVAFGLEDEE